MRNVVALVAVIFLAGLLPAPAFSFVAPPAESGGGSNDEGSRGNRFLTLFNRAGSEEDEPEEDEVEEDDPRSFTMPTVVAPLSSHGHLTGYAYVQIRVRVAAGHNLWDVRDDAHYALDAAVRAAYRTPVSNEDGTGLDNDRAVEVWLAALGEHYGASAIERIEIRQADTRIFRR